MYIFTTSFFSYSLITPSAGLEPAALSVGHSISIQLNYKGIVVRLTGVEPITFASGGRRSIQLSYKRISRQLSRQCVGFLNAPGGTRTPSLQIRNLTWYPVPPQRHNLLQQATRESNPVDDGFGDRCSPGEHATYTRAGGGNRTREFILGKDAQYHSETPTNVIQVAKEGFEPPTPGSSNRRSTR